MDDCHRHVCSMTTGGSSMHHVWIASQGSHEIRLYHATHYACLLETSIRTAVTQKLQGNFSFEENIFPGIFDDSDSRSESLR